MRRDEFEHVIAAAANVVGEDEFVVIGSQAVLGSHPQAPELMLVSLEVDLYPLHNPDRADAVDAALGDGSQFHRSFGYYAHGVRPSTVAAPRGWEERLLRVPILPRPSSKRTPVAWCLEAHDLVLAKCVRGSQRDWDYGEAALGAGIVEAEVLLARVGDLPVAESARVHIAKMLRGLVMRL